MIKADGSTELRKFKTALDDAGPLSPALGKIGARHSKMDKDRIKQIHDLLADLDPDCCAGTGVPGAHVEMQPDFSPQAGEHGDDVPAATTRGNSSSSWSGAWNSRWPRRLAP